ncbi:Pre-mRNA-splicing factor SYF1 [Colletotrichum orbiculare MAFF 240422]|uniref:Pre-mRNA-splicing factor SYF1 n=1 Tax=Colletotrichum orbiculare (strain 104-T / ATCC 96160 / CBS 514.97 / LARS 414 / MAFF 240422) TaxID=1213857 RepID=A0A484FHQ7_COLOR|nr:Pre-mRNA-splicing factor SYF1 [Colletotrichum orbiculare MAFF 240422]
MPATVLPIGSSRRPDLNSVSDADSIYEQDIARSSGSTKPWLAYIQFKLQHGTLRERSFVFERACRQLPRSYKLWKMYLAVRVKHVSQLNPAAFALEYQKVNALFERALILLNKMPRIWELYLEFLTRQPLVTFTRRTFDRALRALPLTQHNRIWGFYVPFANSAAGITAVKPSRNLIVEYAAEVETGHETGIDVDRIIRSGIIRFADQRGKLWCGLATYWIRRGNFERARDIFEEAITTVMTVRDFTLVFDCYTEFEESIVGALMEVASDRADRGVLDEEADFELDIRMMRFEQLMDRRPFLLNDVVLRQNPNNVTEWEKRVALWGDNKLEIVQTYTAAIATIQPKKAVGPFHQLWANYAKFYERGGDLRNARVIMERAVKVPFKSVAELADMWIEWAEMELRNENFDDAVKIVGKAVQAPRRSTVDYFDETLSPQQRVHKSWKLWSFYLDLVESVSSLEDTKKVYERIFELRIATPQTVVNYANLLEEHQYFEESFKIYERGLDLFSYPVAFELWNLYLTKAVDRKIGIERLRDLFEQAIEDCPPKFAKVIYLMYGNLEEERGLARHAMRIYERATRAVADEDRADMFNFYITKSASNFGLPSTRPIYEKAISTLPDSEARDMCLKFADMEKRLGEIDRARAIYGHASQFCDPRTSPEFWAKWEAFEVQHGNEETYKEMLRIKRSVQAQYNTDVNFIASQALARSQRRPEDATAKFADSGVADAMAALERQAKAPAGFVAASDATVPYRAVVATVFGANPDAIDIDDNDG